MDFESFSKDHQAAAHIDPEERYLYYALLRQSGNQHIKLKVNLQNNFTTKNKMPQVLSTNYTSPGKIHQDSCN